MDIKKIFLIITDPMLLFRKLKSRVVKLPKSLVRTKIHGISFEFDFTYDPVIKTMYFGLYEPSVVKLMRKFLKKARVFIDVGTNIGYLSVVAMGFVGRSGQVHCFEPVPEYFNRLKNLVELNKGYNFVINQCALDEKDGRANIDITTLENIGWNTMVPSFMSNETKKEAIEVITCRLDNYIKENIKGKNVDLIKIDAEGYEFPILRGLSGYFETHRDRPPIICEIAPAAYPLLHLTLIQLLEYTAKYGYEAFSVYNRYKKVDITALKETTNVIFLSHHRGPG